MSNLVPARGPLTDAFLDHLEVELGQLQILVGDGLAPPEGGWTGGQPQGGHFISYVTVATGEAVPRERETIAGAHSAWSAVYQLRHVGAVREQADYTADMVRRAALSFAPRAITLGGPWRVVAVMFSRLGGITRNDATDPPTWECTDQVALWIDRSRG